MLFLRHNEIEHALIHERTIDACDWLMPLINKRAYNNKRQHACCMSSPSRSLALCIDYLHTRSHFLCMSNTLISGGLMLSDCLERGVGFSDRTRVNTAWCGEKKKRTQEHTETGMRKELTTKERQSQRVTSMQQYRNTISSSLSTVLFVHHRKARPANRLRPA